MPGPHSDGCVWVARCSTPNRLGLELWFCPCLAVWPQTSYLASLSLSFFIHKIGIVMSISFRLLRGLKVIKCTQCPRTVPDPEGVIRLTQEPSGRQERGRALVLPGFLTRLWFAVSPWKSFPFYEPCFSSETSGTVKPKY